MKFFFLGDDLTPPPFAVLAILAISLAVCLMPGCECEENTATPGDITLLHRTPLECVFIDNSNNPPTTHYVFWRRDVAFECPSEVDWYDVETEEPICDNLRDAVITCREWALWNPDIHNSPDIAEMLATKYPISPHTPLDTAVILTNDTPH